MEFFAVFPQVVIGKTPTFMVIRSLSKQEEQVRFLS